MGKLFGTDGVRGEANSVLTPELAFKIGRAAGYIFTREARREARRVTLVIIAIDGRQSGGMLEAALTAGLCSVGILVTSAGVLPTPGVPLMVKAFKATAGAMISASHNPAADNGIKFFNNAGYKLSDDLEAEIEAIVNDLENGIDNLPRPVGGDISRVRYYIDPELEYEVILLQKLPNFDFSNMKIALDCANGATSEVARSIFRALKANFVLINNEPDGMNINDNCGSTHIEGLQKYVKENGLDIGFAFDGDGDRMLAVDDKGELIDGDVILAVCGLHMKNKGKLNKNTIVATTMSNMGLEIMCRENGINLIRTDVGDRYVAEKMLEGYNLGGEQSGHIIFSDISTGGDGILTTIKFLEVMQETKKSASELAKVFTALPQILVNVSVPNERKHEISTHELVLPIVKEVEEKLANSGRVLFRPSGTEPLVRIMIEGTDKHEITEMAEKIKTAVESVTKM